MTQLKANDFVIGIYKTGKYIGELVSENETTFVVKILAVLKHPIQGDLHHPKQVDQGFFHERKALSFGEKANIPKIMVKPYEGEVPPYTESLQTTFLDLLMTLREENSAFATRSIAALESIKREYELMYAIKI
ncbi:kinase-associated lipoprotein B [Bacillus spongiae]|uniref:Kinase-associated lipoprotein B n=1 Tax=Bacillus spongiae TaxID=2683610 RepID=A0ABU8HEJ2_9BACI